MAKQFKASTVLTVPRLRPKFRIQTALWIRIYEPVLCYPVYVEALGQADNRPCKCPQTRFVNGKNWRRTVALNCTAVPPFSHFSELKIQCTS